MHRSKNEIRKYFQLKAHTHTQIKHWTSARIICPILVYANIFYALYLVYRKTWRNFNRFSDEHTQNQTLPKMTNTKLRLASKKHLDVTE